MKVLWLRGAAMARYSQLDYVAKDDPHAAIALDAAIDRHTEMLAGYPNIGRIGRVKGTRELVIANTPFIAVYRVRTKEKRVEILHLLHGRQRWPVSGAPGRTRTGTSRLSGADGI